MKKDSCLTHKINENYNEIAENPNKSFQPTETGVFEFDWINFPSQSITSPTLSCEEVSAAET